MTEALELTEEQTAKIYPFAARVEREKAEILRGLGAEMMDLRRVIGESGPKDEDLAARVEAIRKLRLSLQEKDLEFETVPPGEPQRHPGREVCHLPGGFQPGDGGQAEPGEGPDRPPPASLRKNSPLY